MEIRAKIYLIIFLSFSCTFTYGQGFIWNEEQERKFISEVPELEIGREIIPSSYSLVKYLPSNPNDVSKRLHQGNTKMCLAYALAVGRTILYAKNHDITDINEINDNSFSPFFTYILSVEKGGDSCNIGLLPWETMYHSKKYGMVMMKDVEFNKFYPYTEERLFCSGYPNIDFKEDFEQASKYRIDNYLRVPERNQIKFSISEGNPVIVAMDVVPESFILMGKWGKKSWDPSIWNKKYICMYEAITKKRCYGYIDHMTAYCSKHLPSDYEEGAKHAMLLIGYDDAKKSFLILNSWENWGDKGTMWVSYDDFEKYFNDFSLSITKQGEDINLESTNPSIIPKDLIKDVYSKQAVSSKDKVKIFPKEFLREK